MFLRIASVITILGMMALSTTDSLAQRRMISHVTTSTGGFATTIILENLNVDSQDYSLQVFDAAGNEIGFMRGTLAGEETISMTSADLGDNASHFFIEGGDFRATAAYTAETVGGSPAHVQESSNQATRFRLFGGNWESVFDGVAVVNTGDINTDIWVAQLDNAGGIVKAVRASEALAPNAKALYIIGSSGGSEFDQADGNTFEIYAEQPLAVTALRGNLPGSTFLWSNQATPAGTAKVKRDAQDVWFIEDGTLYDVIEMMGYSVAKDRLWQMDLFRRNARGTLSEVFGNFTLAQDQFTRTTNYSDEEYAQFYADFDPEIRGLVKAYVNGANRRIAEVEFDDSQMPVEFILQGQSEIARFEPIDVMAFLVFLLRSFDPNGYGAGQIRNAALLEDFQANFPEQSGAMFNDIVWVNDSNAYTMIPNLVVKNGETAFTSPAAPELDSDIDFRSLSQRYGSMLNDNVAVQEALSIRLKGGSYAWVVSGDRTDTGNPMIYSGPQMGFQNPSLTLEGSIRGGGLELSGMTLPLVPLIVIGRTPEHAWSMQVGHAHTADMYVESPDVLAGEPHRTEIVKVGSTGEVSLDVYRSEHGPIVISDPPVAWKYAHWGNELDTMEAFLRIARADDIDEVGEALRLVGVSQHFCYADNEGNIAYWMSGRDPIRPEGEYRLPQGVAGTVLEYDTAVVRDLAHDRNTPRGWYGGWNNKAAADYPNAPFGDFHTYGEFHRAHAVAEVLSSQETWTFEEIREVALNIATTDSFGDGGNPFSFVKDRFLEIIEGNGNADRNAAVAIVNAWDGHFVDGGTENWATGPDRSDGYVLASLWVDRVLALTFDDESSQIGPISAFNTLLHMMDTNGTSLPVSYDWFSNLSNGDAPQTLDEIVVQGLDEAIAALGLDQRPWGTGARGTIDFSHNIFGIQHSMPFSSRSTYAHCVEMGENGPLRIESMFPLGQSGMIFPGIILDEHFLSMTEFFDNFVMRVFPLFD